ncbi:MAG: type II toxin-antitoxin system RelE/ParE family toxin [Magnetococcus sp. YQC-5]
MSYSVIITSHAQRQIRKLATPIQMRILQAIRQLETIPRPDGCVKMTNMEHLWRIREGDYRVLYRIQDQNLLVLVLEIGNRREIYR